VCVCVCVNATPSEGDCKRRSCVVSRWRQMQEYTRQQLLHMIIAAKNGSLFCINTIYLLFYLIFNCTSYIVLLVRVCFHSGKFVFYYFLCTFDDLSRWSRVVLTPSSNHSCDRWVTGVQSNQMPVRVFPRRIISLLPPWRGSDLCACAHQRTRTRERRTKTAPITGIKYCESGMSSAWRSTLWAQILVCVWERWAAHRSPVESPSTRQSDRARGQSHVSAVNQQRATVLQWWVSNHFIITYHSSQQNISISDKYTNIKQCHLLQRRIAFTWRKKKSTLFF